MQKRIISYLTITGPSTVAGISEVTGINARTVAANMSALHNSSLIKKLYNVRVYGRTVATGRRDCWVYGPAPQQKEA
jgi:predicted transcriptional regulator